ncbi:MAG: SDR family oxidoreductase [Bacteroidales bacterium]|nr:SDR family oxidoreductase [Bacteroidales bacterium]
MALNERDKADIAGMFDVVHHVDFKAREIEEPEDRNCYERDYARILYSASFRRLQGKMQILGLGMTTDISSGCIYLLSDASRWVTGQNLIIDGGYTVK